jgi:hypothetical protein
MNDFSYANKALHEKFCGDGDPNVNSDDFAARSVCLPFFWLAGTWNWKKGTLSACSWQIGLPNKPVGPMSINRRESVS